MRRACRPEGHPGRWLAVALAALSLLAACDRAASPAPEKTAASAVVTDPATGLRWLRCALGQTWQDGRCAGEAEALGLMDAQARVEALNAKSHEGIAQWRLPSIVELAALRRCDHGLVDEQFTLELSPEQAPVTVPRWCAGETTTPTIDTARFPGTPPRKFWSGSGSEAAQHFYAVDFGNAWIGLNEAAEATHAVRPVADGAR
ncbi:MULTISPECIES: DUF1566 domain-containing protein [unclassified Variovorax]|uniref:Lcl C-terminal domain-containing protein n=1 Tax=unclassified Variovorax TaxID=663243 RepID=UPI002574E431|nr:MULTISPECIES: DUF1566 domain-containing protein [unclassified Variovorax]MDM0086921.1 DUF1566 domain-containing protein [Variovorax sp. J22G40]MDM0144823.1 DUF1566 domain-containing protein [Variovorax sp. J2P1-31]